MYSNGIAGLNAPIAQNNTYPGSYQTPSQYATPNQSPISVSALNASYEPKTDSYSGQMMASGGDVKGSVDASFGELSPEEEDFIKFRAMVSEGNQKYDSRYMPLRLDDRPLSPIQAAMMRLQAEKQIGGGNARAGISALAAALPNRQGVTTIPGAYDVGYNTAVGPGNLDVSAYRAMRGMSDGKVPYGVNARYSVPFVEGGIASIRHFDDGGQAQGHWEMNGDSGRYVEAPKETGSWTPDQPVLLQTMDQMIAGDTSGKSFNPTEHGYKWDAEYGKFMNPNGSTLLVGSTGAVINATPALKDYEFNGQYWNPAGENVSWNPEKNQTAYKIGGVEVPIGRENMKGIAALTDAEGKPRMQIDKSGQPIFTEPEGLHYTGNFMADTGAPMIAGLLLGGTTALASGAFGAGTTMAGEAAAAGSSAAYPGISSADLGTTLTNVPSSTVPYSNIGLSSADLGTTATNAINVSPNGIASLEAIPTNTLTNADLAKMAQMGDVGGSPGYKLAADTAGMNMYQKAALGTLALKGLSGGSGGGGTPTQTSSQNTSQATPAPITQAPMPYAFPTYSPNQSYPGMNYSPTPYAQPMLYRYAEGGIAGLDSGDLGSYSDGGRLLKGGGTGLSDDIPATIGGNQPARLADGEFVVSSDVVSALGGGSTDAGAKKLYAMMDRIRKNAHGTKRQIRAINDKKVLPA